ASSLAWLPRTFSPAKWRRPIRRRGSRISWVRKLLNSLTVACRSSLRPSRLHPWSHAPIDTAPDGAGHRRERMTRRKDDLARQPFAGPAAPRRDPEAWRLVHGAVSAREADSLGRNNRQRPTVSTG